jgi:hypothetical protein
MDTNFNVNEFLSENIDAPLDTKRDPIPEGEYSAQIGIDDKSVDLQAGVSAKNQKPWLRLDLTLELTDPNLAAQLKRDKVVVRYGLMLDLNEQGKLDTRPQRNINLGKLRDAVDQNRPGNWNFFMLKGQPLKVKIKHRANEENPMEPFSEVAGVTKL